MEFVRPIPIRGSILSDAPVDCRGLRPAGAGLRAPLSNGRAVHHAQDRQDAQDIAIKMSIPIYLIYTWLHAQNLDPEALLREKHTYNKTRPYRHGGKRI